MATYFLATVVGWYLVVFSMLMLARQTYLKSIMADVINQRGLFFVLAIITFILGLLMVASHNIWVMGWPVIITIFSWLVLVSGVFRLFNPEAARKMAMSFLEHAERMRVMGIILLLLGLFLLYRTMW